MRTGKRLSAALSLGLAVVAAAPAVAGASAQSGVWDAVSGNLPNTRGGSPADIRPDAYRAFTLDRAGLKAGLAGAPKAGASARAASSVVLSVPKPDGGFERFEVYEAPIMEAGLAAKHPDIKTWAGRGVDDRTATIRADITKLGFHASVRSREGAYFVDPYYRHDDSVYVSYFSRDLSDDENFVEQEVEELAPQVKAAKALAGPEVQLRTYRLALITDPTYATYHGGPANVTAAKVTLMNRVNQIYEDESAIRMILIADNDKLNLDTVALANGANGPCGSAPCYPASNSCGNVLSRNRIVIGQIIGAGNYDIGHIAMGNAGGGVANLGVVGGNNKAGGCTGLATPTGDYFAVDYVAHEMGHQFAGNHTFNGILGSCGGNRSGATSVEPGSGSSIMAYAGICQRDNLQPHSDPYWVPKSYEEVLALVTGDRPPISEVQTISLRDFGGTDSVTLTYGGTTIGPFVRGTNYTQADLQATLSGNEVQKVVLDGYDANGDSYTLTFKGASSHPIVRGQNNTAAGIANAIVGGNEQQQVTLANFNGTTQSFQISIGGNTSTVLGQGGAAVSNANVAAAINAIAGFAGGATVTGAGNTGFSVTFAGASAATDIPAISIVNCTGTCTSTVRENAKGGAALSTWPAGATLTVGTVTDSGYSLLLAGAPFTGVDADPFTVTNATGATGSVLESVKGGSALKGGVGKLGAGATGTVSGFGGGTFDDTGFQVTFGGTLANVDQAPLGLTVDGGTGFVGETARGGPIQNKGFTVTPTGNFAPDVVGPGNFTIPPRTPFALTGTATDPNGDALTYMWEQVDRAGISGGSTAGTALLSNTKTNGALFRQFGAGTDIPLADSLKYHSPGLNLATANPTRVFPDMGQILAGNTNAATGTCPDPPPAPAAVPTAVRECFSEWLPTTEWIGFLSDRTMTFRMTARDARPGGGALTFVESKVTVAQLAGPFRVTSQPVSEVVYGTPVEDDHLGRRRHGRRADQRRQRQDQPGRGERRVDGDRREHGQRRLVDGRLAGRGDDQGPRQGRGGRQRLLRRLRRGPDLGRRADAAGRRHRPGHAGPDPRHAGRVRRVHAGRPARLRRHLGGQRHLDGRRRGALGQRPEHDGPGPPRQRRLRDADGAAGPRG